MTRRSERPKTRRHIWVFDEDWEWICQYYAVKDLTPGLVVRELLHKFVLKRKDEQARAAEDAEKGER
jgi:hypothetical protein